jgi:helix-turn-helix protein
MTPEPSEALSPEGVYSLYLGGLALEDEQQRRDACYATLLMGRLGLLPEELTHLHEDWVDWERGEIQIPARDPCACRYCWADARTLKSETGTDRSVSEIVTDTCWSPPDGPAGARTIPFGWSRRLTAAIHGVLGQRPYLDTDTAGIEQLLTAAADNAWELDDEITSDRLRASAGEFLASVGFGPRRLSDLLAIDEETAGQFAKVGGGELREYLYRALDPQGAPDICGEDSQYRLVCDPTPFEREPFDPREYDARWRGERAERVQPRGRNPRPVEAPAEVDFDPAAMDIREPSADSGSQLVSDSLSDWVRRRESQRRQYAETGDSAVSADTDADAVAYRDQITSPVQVSVSTRFAAQGIENGRPAGGSVVLGQREVVLVSRDQTGVADTLRIPFDSIVDIAPGYVPGPLEGVFEETVGVAYHDAQDERKIAVCELPRDIGWDVQQTLFASLLDDVETVTANLSEGIDDINDIDPETKVLSTTPRTLKLEDLDSDALPVRIRLSTIVGIEQKPMETEVGYEMGLTIHHLRVNANVVTMEVRPTDEVEKQLLGRYLTKYHDRQLEKARNASLSNEQREVLDALHDAGDGRDLVAIVDMNTARVANVVASLKDLGLVRDSRTGVALTGTGYLVTSGGSLLYEGSG